METLHPIIFNQVRDLTSIQFTRTHISICIECWGRGGGGGENPGNVLVLSTTYTQLQTILSSQTVQHLTELFFTSQKLMVKKLELTLRNIDEKCFNIKKTKLKFVSRTSLKIKEKYNLSFQEHKTKENLNSH